MISYIKGLINIIENDYIIIENNNVGFKIFTSNTTQQEINLNNEYKIYTKMIVREDDISLYGFAFKEELEMFEMLISVSSIGPKNALNILSSLGTKEIKKAILNNDIKLLSKAKGIGQKTASRIILELVDKIKDLNFGLDRKNETKYEKNSKLDVAAEALENLGFRKDEIIPILSKFTDEDELEVIIKESLKLLSR
ncbi:MAG: Holliday junction branch migration protein RuvA [Peptoniphilaceae bacterium]|nr:Holliday junction branch migration protein RuvA [Peptoniphilaceae bacterium]MDD7383444.1 Holliday junction branch migration protein RuvA [Peptoniphilaceae bacterium]MDY3738492.1 Holliday junction branch migration protein RuvA [Peptoniphilaceae bacterium]